MSGIDKATCVQVRSVFDVALPVSYFHNDDPCEVFLQSPAKASMIPLSPIAGMYACLVVVDTNGNALANVESGRSAASSVSVAFRMTNSEFDGDVADGWKI